MPSNILAIVAILAGVLLIFSAANAVSPVELLKALLTGGKLPERGSGKK